MSLPRLLAALALAFLLVGFPPASAAPSPPLRGMGYNPTYATADVDPAERAERIERDLRLMSEVGVNLVLGWEPGVFDETLLDAAARHGIAVILPFILRPDWDYADPALRADVTREVLAWIARYQSHPGVLMWGIGNEVTLEMDAASRHAFAAFYVELFQAVRAADPSRPVTLREAEDVFAPYLAEAFGRQQGIWREDTPTPAPPAVPNEMLGPAAVEWWEATPTPAPTWTPTPEPPPRPLVVAPEGFIYGVNFYTERVGPALIDWVENTAFDTPLLVSEYAPAGVGRAARAERLATLHAMIRSAGPRVLGSAPYTWTTAGPEAVDAYFGLVDASGRPTDPALAALARLYGVEPPPWSLQVDPGRDIASAVELPKLLNEAVSVGARLAGRDEEAVHTEVGLRASEAAALLEAGPEHSSLEASRARDVASLIGWARALSEIVVPHEDDPTRQRRLFPGMREALPLLEGMGRWSKVEPTALETARSFVAAVVRRDLTTLGGIAGGASATIAA